MKKTLIILIILLTMTGCGVVKDADTVDLFGAEEDVAVCTTKFDIFYVFGLCDVIDLEE